ncbi:MAG: pseudouridine synthase [Rhodanobacter sp.]
MRVNKFISEAGLCSRREADEWLLAGRVSINGAIVSTGAKALEDDEVCVDGEIVHMRVLATTPGAKKAIYIALNKPTGITCTTEKDVAGNIIEFVDHAQRIFPIGRLDKDSEGLILLTSNGDIVNEILRSENHHEKEYLVAVNKAVTDEFIAGMSKGVRIHGQMTQRCRVRKIAKFGFSIVLTQGLNRQIRLMATAFGYRVTQLRRVRIDNVKLGHLKVGQWRNLTEAELKGLLPERKHW